MTTPSFIWFEHGTSEQPKLFLAYPMRLKRGRFRCFGECAQTAHMRETGERRVLETTKVTDTMIRRADGRDVTEVTDLAHLLRDKTNIGPITIQKACDAAHVGVAVAGGQA